MAEHPYQNSTDETRKVYGPEVRSTSLYIAGGATSGHSNIEHPKIINAIITPVSATGNNRKQPETGTNRK